MGTVPDRDSTRNTFGAIVSIVVGLVLVLAGVWMRNVEARERVTLVETQGTVVDSVKGREHDNKTGKDTDSYTPVIAFQAGGAAIRFTGIRESFRQSDGNKVVVRYDPANPAVTARVVGSFDGLIPWSLFALGGFGLLSGLGDLLGVRRLFRRSS